MTDASPDRAPSGGDALVDVLDANTVDAAFGIVSVHNLPLVDALDRRSKWVATRTEAGALNAADGYARSRDGLGCAVTSTGTGAGNAAGALVEALTAASPVLHVTGQIDREHLGLGRGVIHETRDQLAMLAAVSKRATTMSGPAIGHLAEAAAAALARDPHQGPVSVEWPIDEQYGATTPPSAPLQDRGDGDGALEVAGLVEGDVDAAIALLRGARRPVVWAGGGARWARQQLSELLDRLGAPLLTSNAGRGVVPETDPRVVGNYGASAAGAALLAEADVLLSIGTHFRSNETRTYKLPFPQRHVQIDIDAAALGRAYPVDVGLKGAASTVLAQLIEALDGGTAEADWSRRGRSARHEARSQLIDSIGPHATICEAMNRVLGPDANLVRDITIPNSAWGNRLLDVNDPTQNIYPRGGGIGQAVGMAIGAATGRPDRHTAVLVGDGGLQVQLGELATFADERLPVTIVVFDDGGYGVLRNMQDRHLSRRSGVDLFTPDLVAAAGAHDFRTWNVDNADNFEAAFEAAVASGEPSLVRVDSDAIGPMPVPFVPPVHIPETT